MGFLIVCITILILLINPAPAFALFGFQPNMSGNPIEFFLAGGSLMWPLLATAITAIAIIFERYVTLKRTPSRKQAEKELEIVENALASSGMEECAKVISKGKGLLNYIFAHLVRRYDTLLIEKRDLERVRGAVVSSGEKQADAVSLFLVTQTEVSEFRDELRYTIDEASMNYVTKYLAALGICGNIAPLLGLMGTVFGMIQAFNSIASSGTGDPRVVAAGIAQALITTAAGLVIAVPCVIMHRYLGQMAEAARETVDVYSSAFSTTIIALLERGKKEE